MPDESQETEKHSLLYNALKLLSAGKLPYCIDDWRLVGMSRAEKYGDEFCVCTYPIFRMYSIRNLYNKNEVVIDSCCINQDK